MNGTVFQILFGCRIPVFSGPELLQALKCLQSVRGQAAEAHRPEYGQIPGKNLFKRKAEGSVKNKKQNTAVGGSGQAVQLIGKNKKIFSLPKQPGFIFNSDLYRTGHDKYSFRLFVQVKGKGIVPGEKQSELFLPVLVKNAHGGLLTGG